MDDIPVAAIKIGMLSTAGIVCAVARALLALRGSPQQQRQKLPIVVDPVCVSTSSGYVPLEHDALEALVHELLPLAAVLTPSMDEAALLLHCLRLQHNPGSQEEPPSISSIGDMVRVACELRCALGDGAAVLLKGGQLPRGSSRLADVVSAGAEMGPVDIGGTGRACRIRGVVCQWVVLCIPDADADSLNTEILLRASGTSSPVAEPGFTAVVVDVLCERVGEGKCACTLFVRPYLESNSTHGSGCTLSAALACALARGEPRACSIFILFSPLKLLFAPLFCCSNRRC